MYLDRGYTRLYLVLGNLLFFFLSSFSTCSPFSSILFVVFAVRFTVGSYVCHTLTHTLNRTGCNRLLKGYRARTRCGSSSNSTEFAIRTEKANFKEDGFRLVRFCSFFAFLLLQFNSIRFSLFHNVSNGRRWCVWPVQEWQIHRSGIWLQNVLVIEVLFDSITFEPGVGVYFKMTVQ